MAGTCVVGLQWGDEAKGKIVDLLGDNFDFGPFLYTDDHGGKVLMEAQGPGVIDRWWMTGNSIDDFGKVVDVSGWRRQFVLRRRTDKKLRDANSRQHHRQNQCSRIVFGSSV